MYRAAKTRPPCFTACNFRSIVQIGTKFVVVAAAAQLSDVVVVCPLVCLSSSMHSIARMYKKSELMLVRRATHQFDFVRRLSCAIHSRNVHRSLKSREIHQKTVILGFKVIQSHRCWYLRKASLCLSATVLTLDELIMEYDTIRYDILFALKN